MASRDEARRELARRELARRKQGATPNVETEAEPAADSFADKINAFTGSAIEGVPVVGPYLLKGVDHLKSALRGQSVEDIEARLDKTQADNPITATAGSIAGGIAGTAPLVAAAPGAFGAGAGGLLARSGAAALSGGALGATDSAVRSGGDPGAIAWGAGTGFGLGAVGPGAAKGIGKGAGWIFDKARGWVQAPDSALTGISPKAVRYATETVADPSRRAAMEADMARLGPDAMLADVSPEWMGVARGAASRPGQRDLVVNALLGRDSARNQRLATDLDASLGPAPVPSQVEASLAANREAAGQGYGQAFQGATAVDTRPLADTLDTLAVDLRGPARQAVVRVREMLDIPGNRGNLDPNPGSLFQTRQAIDGMMATETNPQVVRVLTAARRAVDDEVSRAVPGVKDVDAAYSELMRQSEALQRGGQVLDSGKTAIRPQELQQEITQSALPQGNQVGPSAAPVRLRQGARAEIDRVAGVNANDPAAMQKLVKGEGDWNRDKLRTVFGQEPADRALGAVDRETTFYRTAGRVTSGSDTAMAQRFGDFLDEAATPNRVPTDTTLTGAGLRGAQRVIQSMLGSNSQQKAEKFATELGRLSIAQGPERDRAFQAIVNALVRQQRSRGVSASAEGVARALLAGSAQASQQQLAQ